MPDTSASLYEQLFPLTTVMKQRMVDNMSGDSLNERWGEYEAVGTASTVAANDEVNGGILISAPTTNDQISIGYGTTRLGGIHQYSPIASVIIFVSTVSTKTNFSSSTQGLHNEIRGDAAGNDGSVSIVSAGTGYTDFRLRTLGSGGLQTDTTTGVTLDTAAHVFKIENKASSCEFTIDGVLKATSTTNLATTKQQPVFGLQTNATGSSTIKLRYVECYNT